MSQKSSKGDVQLKFQLTSGALILLTFLSSDAAVWQQAPSAPRFSTSTAAIVVDVVVRDRQHRAITGLRAADFEVYEDGVRQSITSFDAIHRPSTQPSVTTVAEDSGPGPTADEQIPAVVALVFEQLSAGGRQLAHKAASTFVSDTLTKADFAGVFAIDRALHVLVPYTNDLGALQAGLRDASMRAGYALDHAGQVPGAEYSSPEAGQSSQASTDDSPYIPGHGTFEALERLIDSMRVLPGRKAVVLFSEGLALMAAKADSMLPEGSWHDTDSWLTDNRREHFTRVFERANRAHVAFYTFDAAGLRIESPLIQKCFGCAPYVGLEMLADETGGAFVENTNDLVGPVRRVGDDLRHYYLLGYTSTNPTLDDK